MLPGDIALQEEKHHGNSHDDDAQRRGKVVIVADLTHELIVQYHRIGAVAFADEHGRTEIGEHPHEHQQGGSQHRGQHQRQNDAGDSLEVACSQAFRCFVQGIVQILQCAADVHVHQREGLQRENQHDTGKAVDSLEGHTEQPVDKAGNHAVAAQQLNPRISADEGRRQVADHNADVQPLAARDLILPGDVGHQKAQRGADERGHDGHFEGVDQRIGVVFAGEETGEVLQRKASVTGVNYALIEDQHQRIHHEDQEQRQHQQRQKRPDGRVLLLVHGLTLPRGSR